MKKIIFFFFAISLLYACDQCDTNQCEYDTPMVVFRLTDTSGVDLILADSIPIDSIVIFDTLNQKNIAYDTDVNDTAYWIYFSYNGASYEEINYRVNVPDSNQFYIGFFSQIKDEECCNYLDVFNVFAKGHDYVPYGTDTIDVLLVED